MEKPSSLKQRVLLGLIYLAYFIFAYFWAQHRALRQPDLPTPLLPGEGKIPFLPWTIWIYFATYGLIAYTFLILDKREGLWRFFLAQMAGMLVCHLTWLFYPVRYALRPPLTSVVADPLTFWALSLLYGADEPLNCLPSLHVTSIFICYFLIRRDYPEKGRWFLPLTIVTSLSILTVKQHYLLDAITGFLLALILGQIFLKSPSRTRQRPTRHF